MSMSGYIPTEEDIAAMMRDIEQSNPANANPEYARQMLIKMKLMFREIGRVDEELLRKELEEFRQEPEEI
jgi:hypothetical protein